ncbi:MAG TPA: hypothetical protein VH744_09745, partial [Terriglobales bacterium]
RSGPQGTFYAFAGAASTWMGTSFFQSAEAEDPVAALFFEQRLTDRLRFISRSILSRRNTSLQGLEWQVKSWLKTSITGGVGSGHSYFASALDAESRQLTVKGGYFSTNREFRRIMLPSISNSEAEGANIEATYRFTPTASLTAGHRNLLQLLTLTGPLSGASVNHVGGTFQVAQVYFGVGLFNSSFAERETWGANFYAGHRFGEHLDVTANYFRSRTAHQPGDTMVTGTFREILNPRFSFLQLVTYSNGQWATSFGGEYLTNRLNLRADYQTVYLPFRGNRPFEQALSLNAALRVLGPFQVTAASSVAPDGSLRYTFGASTYLYRYNGLVPWGAESADSYKFPKYLVQGVVQDEGGRPVSGAALRLDGDIVYTDDSGRFLYRVRKHKKLAFEVAVDEFLVPGVYQVISAPATVDTNPQDKAPDIEIVVRRVRSATLY